MITALEEVAAAEEVAEIVALIRPLLAGRDPSIQGVILAELLALWLAGHRSRGNIDGFREKLLRYHVDLVRRLIPFNEKEIPQRRRQ